MEMSRSIDDGFTATATGGTTTTLTTTDSEIAGKPNDYFNGSEISTISGTGAAQVRRVDDFGVVAGVATFTIRTWTAPGSDTVFEVHNIQGKGYRKAQYDDAINAAIRVASDVYFTDLSNISFALERGRGTGGVGGTTPHGLQRFETPMPSGFLYLWGVDVLRRPPLESHSIANLNAQRAFGDAAGRTRVGQGFQIDAQALIAYIAVFMGKVGSPTDNLTCVVETDSAGIPSGTAVTNGTSDTVGGASIQERFRLVVFSFTPPMLLQEATTYHLTLRRSGAADAANYYIVGEDDGNNYPDGALSTRDASAWTAVSGSDLLFSISPQADWAELVRPSWQYRPQSTDQLLIRGPWVEGTPVQLRGGAAIAEPATESTNVPVRAEWVVSYALAWLQRGRTGLAVPDPRGTGSLNWMQAAGVQPPPSRAFPPNTVRIYA